MFPIPHFAPPYVDALGSAIAGIAAAIAGAIAVRMMGSKQRNAVPVAQAQPGSASHGEDEPALADRPKAPPASVRLALPPEQADEARPVLSDTDPQMAAIDPDQLAPHEGTDATESAAAS